MIEINPYIVSNLIAITAGLAMSDEEVEELSSINPNDEDQVKEVIRRFIIPEYIGYRPEVKKRLKESLRYLLNTEDKKLIQRVMNMNDPPFYFPNPPKKYFIWIWEELFPNESYLMEDLNNYVVKNSYQIYE